MRKTLRLVVDVEIDAEFEWAVAEIVDNLKMMVSDTINGGGITRASPVDLERHLVDVFEIYAQSFGDFERCQTIKLKDRKKTQQQSKSPDAATVESQHHSANSSDSKPEASTGPTSTPAKADTSAGNTKQPSGLPVRAELHTDDYVYDVKFDASPWFEKVDDIEIVELAKGGWGGDSKADEIARFMEAGDKNVMMVLEYCRKVEGAGFEVVVNEPSAKKWLFEYRPLLLKQILEMEEGDGLPVQTPNE